MQNPTGTWFLVKMKRCSLLCCRCLRDKLDRQTERQTVGCQGAVASAHATEEAHGHRAVVDASEQAYLLDTTHGLDLGRLRGMRAASLDGLGY